MLQKVEIIDSGDTTLIAGEHVDRDDAETINQLIEKEGKPAKFIPILNGITRASLQTSSFISQPPFKKQQAVLTEVAYCRKKR